MSDAQILPEDNTDMDRELLGSPFEKDDKVDLHKSKK